MAEGPPIPDDVGPDKGRYDATHLTMGDLGLSSVTARGRLDADLRTSTPPVLDGARSEAVPNSNEVVFTPTPYDWQREPNDSKLKAEENIPGADSVTTPNNVHYLDDYRDSTRPASDTEESGGHKPA